MASPLSPASTSRWSAASDPVVLQQFGIAAVERGVDALRAVGVVLGAHEADHLAVDQVHPLEPLQRQVAAEEAGGAGQQDGADVAGWAGQRRGGGQRRGVEELVQRQVAGVHLGGVAAVHGGEGRPLGAAGTLGVDVAAMAARSLAGLTITPTGTSMSKMSCSRLREGQRGQRIAT